MRLLVRLAFALLIVSGRARLAAADVTLNCTFIPGSPQENAVLLQNSGSTLREKTRWADAGASWTYRIVAPPLTRVSLRLNLADAGPVDPAAPRLADLLTFAAVGADGKPAPVRIDPSDRSVTAYATVPANNPLGDGLRIKVSARGGPVGVASVRVSVQMPDRNGDGLGDAVETMMGPGPNQRAVVIPRPPRPFTSFQTGAPYSPEIAVPGDAVLVYSSSADVIGSWLDKGYTVQTMGGFREGADYVKSHPDEVQRDSAGNPITIGTDSYYMLPTESRNEASKKYYTDALAAGSSAVCPEEPEIFARAGYSEAFKREWRARYGTDWIAPDSSIDARYKAEQLKAFLTQRQIASILTEAERQKPTATRMVAVHSPVTYYQWAITVPHFALFSLPGIQEIIGQVWTGTARSPARAAGVRTERTFEVGYLEYSSLFQLVRGSAKRMWFLMDPVEDNPNRSPEDYQRNYEQTLVASLLFPQVNSYEVMPWPQRIYGRVPPGYATVINNVVGALSEVWRFPDAVMDTGTAGIGTFVSDSMAWQRAQPAPSDYDGFYGLALPLVNHGIPVEVLQLDRATEPGYLNRTNTILLSYDFLKPASADVNHALADWVRRGGSLLIAGGTDVYNDLKESWWKAAGYPSPVEALFADLGIRVRPLPSPAPASLGANLPVALTGDAFAHNLENRRTYTIDLTPYARATGSALVRFEDVKPDDGWGPWLASAEMRFGGKLAASFRTGSDIETRFLAEEHGTGFGNGGRFADRDGYWVYRFDNLPRDRSVTLTLDMAHGFLVKAGSAPSRPPLLEAADASFDKTVQKLRLPPSYAPTYLTPDGSSTPLYRLAGAPAPIVWETRVGNGSVTYAGVPPGFFSATAQSSRWLRALTKRAYEKTLGTYREKSYFLVRRGPYKAVRTLGAEYSAEGRYVNLLSPTLAIVEDPDVPAHGWAFWQDAGPASGPPRVIAVSGRLRARFEQPGLTSFVAQAPSGTEGVARLFAGKRLVAGARGYTLLGQEVPVRTYPDGDTVLVRYPNDADGVVVRVGWK